MKAGEPKMHTGQTVNKVLTQGPYGQMATEKEGTWEDMKKIKKPAIEWNTANDSHERLSQEPGVGLGPRAQWYLGRRKK